MSEQRARIVRRQVVPVEIAPEDELEEDIAGADDEEPEEEPVIVRRSIRPVVTVTTKAEVKKPGIVRKAVPAPEPEEEPEEKPLENIMRRRLVAEEKVEQPVSNKNIKMQDLENEEEAVIKKQPFPEPALQIFRVKSINETVAEDVFTRMFEAMASGESILVTKLESGKWQLATTGIRADVVSKVANGKLSGKSYWDEVLDPAFAVWQEEWKTLTYAEKKKRATKAGATWEEDKDSRVDLMRLTEAYRDKLGIAKYNEQYKSRAARAAIKG
jgi:hypothetical protein